MPIDTSIYSQIKPIQIDNPMDLRARMMQFHGMQNQNKLAQLALGEKEREVAGENALASLVTAGKTGDEVFNGLAGQGYGRQAIAYRKQEADRIKSDAELKSLSLGNQSKEFELGEKKRIAGIQKNAALLTNPNFSYELFVNHVQQSVANKEVAPEAAQAFIQQAPQDPAQLKAFLTQQLLSSLSPDKQLEASAPKTEFRDIGGQIVAIQNNPNLPGYGQPIQGAGLKKTMTPGEIAADARGREANRLKGEENQINKQGVVGKQVRDVELKLQDDYRAESKGFSETATAMKKVLGAISTADKNPGSALAAGTAFMKLLDPNSVVRESELGMALNASGWFDRALNIAETLQSGKVMTPKQQANLKAASETLFREAKAAQLEVDAAYEQRAKAYGADPSRVIVDRGQRASRNPGANAALPDDGWSVVEVK